VTEVQSRVVRRLSLPWHTSTPTLLPRTRPWQRIPLPATAWRLAGIELARRLRQIGAADLHNLLLRNLERLSN